MTRSIIFPIIFFLISNSVYSQKTIVEGQFINFQKSDSLRIQYEEGFLMNKRTKLEIDSKGSFKIYIDIEYPTLITIRNKSIFFQAYISPKDSISIHADIASKETLNQTLLFSGNLSLINQAFFNIQNNATLKGSYWSTGENIPAQEIANKIKAYYNLKRSLLNSSLAKSNIPDADIEIIKLDSISDVYHMATAVLLLVEGKTLQREKAWEFVKENINASVFVQPDLQKMSISNVRGFWNYTYLSYLNRRDFELNTDFYKNGSYSRMLDRIDTMYNQPVKDYAKAAIIYDLLDSPSLFWTHSIDSLIRLTKSFISVSVLPDKTKQLLIEHSRSISDRVLTSNSPAPPLFATDINGSPVSLADFKDKLVFIDVWASWCGPCIAQMPAVNRLIDHFKGKNIVFLMLSIDEKTADWKNTLQKHRSDAIQLYTSNGFKGGFAKGYSVKGIPRYILIKNSVIINGNAPSPGGPELLIELNKYLN